MKLHLLFAISLCLLPLAKAEERPNILFIFLDDFGWKDTSYAGSDFFETPNLDRLAAEGMVFTDAYSAAANCAPARACLLSGQYTPRHEIFNVGTNPRGKSQHRRLEHIGGKKTLDPKLKTWAHQLQSAGYKTATMGKWHLSDDPLPYGFDLNIGGTHSGGPPKGYYPPHGTVPNLQDAPKDEWVTDTIARKANAFITENRESPWMLYLTIFSVHTPIQAKKDLIGKYEAKAPGELHDNTKMATMIQGVDDAIGTITRKLDELGLAKNTAILFFSDNGGYGPATDMDPLKGYKGTYYEGGIRVPFFVKWPGVVAPNQTNETPIIGVDLYPTLCEMAGAKLPEGQVSDGSSLVGLFKGSELPERAIYWHFPAYLQSYSVTGEQRDILFRSRPCSIIRRGDYKLHQYFEDGALELYNLNDDISESTNLATQQPEKTQELLQELEAWRASVDAPIPTAPNPEFSAEAEAAAILKATAKADKKKAS
ncbi:MAG: sulfatase [Verrucomicrobiota bacterium]